MDDAARAKTTGRLAGLAYLAIIVFSAPGYMILAKLLAGGAQKVLEHVAASQAVLTLALASSAVGFAVWTVLGILLYRLLSSAGRIPALLMLILAVAGSATNLFVLAQLLPLVGGAGRGMDAGALGDIVQSYNRLLLLAQVFSGLWLFPFGWLVIRSRIAPRFMGVCIILGGVFYLLVFSTAFAPGLDQTMAYKIVSAVTGIPGELFGELGICLWLLIKGGRRPDTIPGRMALHDASGPLAQA